MPTLGAFSARLDEALGNVMRDALSFGCAFQHEGIPLGVASAVKWTRLSCRDSVDSQVRLQLFVLAHNLGTFLRKHCRMPWGEGPSDLISRKPPALAQVQGCAPSVPSLTGDSGGVYSWGWVNV